MLKSRSRKNAETDPALAVGETKADPRAAQKTPGVMLYDGKPYAVGLLWFTVQEDNAKGLLQKRVAKTGADFTCQRLHISLQQGFGWLAKGHRRGMPAAAAMIADQLVGEWHGVFEADNGWWYVQVRSDTITPNGDRFFTSEEEAYTLFQKEMSENIWPHAYAPQKWAIAGGAIRELSLKNILDDLATTTLSPTNVTAMFGSAAARNLVLGGLAAAVAIMALLALYTVFFSAPPPMPVSATPVRKVVTAAPLKAPVASAVDAVSPQQLLQQCGQAVAELYQSIPGWVPQTFSCAVGKASMGWQQTTGHLNDARDMGLRKWPQNTTVTFSNRIMTAALTLGNLPKVERAGLPAQEAVLLYLEQNLQPLGALQVKPVVPKPPVPAKPVGKTAPPPAPQPVPYVDIQLLSGFSPQKISPLLTGSGLELVQVQWRIPQAMWQYQIKWSYEAPARSVKPGTAANANAAAATAAAPAAAGGKP